MQSSKTFLKIPKKIASYFYREPLDKILFRKLKEYKRGDIKISLKELENSNDEEVVCKWITLNGPDIYRWEDLKELAKKLNLNLKSLVIIFLIDEINKRKG